MSRMRIAITADPYLPVPPTHYGGIERVIDLLVRELAGRGHEVSLIAHPDSRTSARLIAYGRPPHTGWSNRLAELAQVGASCSVGRWTRAPPKPLAKRRASRATMRLESTQATVPSPGQVVSPVSQKPGGPKS